MHALKITLAAEPNDCQPSFPRAAGLAVLILALALAAGCGPVEPAPEATLTAFFEAVQTRDYDRLYCLMAGAADARELGADETERRAGFERWARARYEAYETGRDAGRVELDGRGLTLVKLFSLGRGTFVTHSGPRSAGPDVRLVESRVRFGYAHIDLSGFSPGTTFYVCGVPVGRVHPVRVPAGSREISLDVLDGVAIEWTLTRAEPAAGCEGGWTIASAEPVPDSETIRELTWVF